jgi:RNA polymerase sigma factor (sigma-70 family)
MINLAISPDMDETLDSAMQSGFKRVRSWRVPPNWSRGDWFEELAAVGMAAAWHAVCEFDPERGVPLAGFGYCRMMTRCLSRYRKEWRYALHLVASDSREKETTTSNHTDLAASSAARADGTYCSNDDLRGAVGALSREQQRLIEQLFWEERTETEVADAMGTNQSTINRRKQAILHGLRMKLRDRNKFQNSLHKDAVRCNVNINIPIRSVLMPLDPICQGIDDEIKGLQQDLQNAAPGEKPAIAAQIGKAKRELQKCRQEHPDGLPPPAPRESARVPGFLPSTSGFRFANSFDPGIPVVTISIPPLGPIGLGDASNGVCGGMVYAVMDLFFAQPRLLPPTATTTPAGGSPLMNYILDRLIAGFALEMGPLSNANRYVDFMSTLDHDTTLSRGISSIIVGIEWPKIKADIDAGRPSPVGLVGGVWVWPTNFAAKYEMLKHCHCVLAYGYDLDDASNLTLLVYDPNDPLADNSTIEMNIGNPTHTTPILTPRITSIIAGNVTFRAFFKHDWYALVTPPAGISPGPAPGP